MLKCLCVFLAFTGAGYHTFARETFEEIKENGLVVLQGTTVKGHTEVNGSLEADKATLGTLKVNGNCKLKDSTVEGEVLINGYLHAENTRFLCEISISSNKLVLENCQVKNIVVRKSSMENQIVELRGKTNVSGQISFESGKGGVITGSDVALQGKITGGEVQK